MKNLDTQIAGFLAPPPGHHRPGKPRQPRRTNGPGQGHGNRNHPRRPAKSRRLRVSSGDFLTTIPRRTDSIVVGDGFIAVQLLGDLGPLAAPAIPAIDHCLTGPGRSGVRPDPVATAADGRSEMADHRRSRHRPGRGDRTPQRSRMVARGPRRRSAWWTWPSGSPALADLERLFGPRLGTHPPPCSGGD